MKKNICPFIDSQNRCTHKNPKANLRYKQKLPMCPFNKANKCELYIYWLELQKHTRELNKTPEGYIKRILEQYKQRWIK